LEDCLAEEILSGHVKDGDTVVIDVDDDGQTKTGDHGNYCPSYCLGFTPSIPGSNARDVLNQCRISTVTWLSGSGKLLMPLRITYSKFGVLLQRTLNR